jgi:hypothetical protein
MPWMLSLLALLSFIVLCATKSLALGFICILLTLGFTTAAIVTVIASRVDGSSRDSGRMLTPEELRIYREQAESKRALSQSQLGQVTPASGLPPRPEETDEPPPAGQV